MKKTLLLLALLAFSLIGNAQKKNTKQLTEESVFAWSECDTTFFPNFLVEDRYTYQYLGFICSTPIESAANVVLHNPSNKGLIDLSHSGQNGKFLGVNASGIVNYYNDGYALTNLNASNLATGTVPTARLGTGTADATTYLAGNNTWLTMPTTSARVFTTPTFSSATTATQLSTTRDAVVQYSFDGTVTISLLAGQSVTVTLQYSDNSGMSTNVVTVDSAVTSNSGVLNLTQTNTLKVGGMIPAGKYRRVTFAVTGSGTATPTTLKSGQEVLLN